MSEVKRASLDELLDFANKVRAAGGGNPLDALMPAVPEDPNQCLIAKNLNFNCSVDGGPPSHEITAGGPIRQGDWVMTVSDEAIRDRIADSLNLAKLDYRTSWDRATNSYEMAFGVVLPREIGQVAADFDNWADALTDDWKDDPADYDEDDPEYTVDPLASDEQKARLRDFWPLIEASEREAYANASFVNEKGEIVL